MYYGLSAKGRPMALKPNWKTLLRKAWSIRLAAIAALLSGCEVVLPLYSDSIPRNLFAALSGLVTVGAIVARVISQTGLSDE